MRFRLRFLSRAPLNLNLPQGYKDSSSGEYRSSPTGQISYRQNSSPIEIILCLAYAYDLSQYTDTPTCKTTLEAAAGGKVVRGGYLKADRQ